MLGSGPGSHLPTDLSQLSQASPRGILAGRKLQSRDDGFHSNEPGSGPNRKRRILVALAIVVPVAALAVFVLRGGATLTDAQKEDDRIACEQELTVGQREYADQFCGIDVG